MDVVSGAVAGMGVSWGVLRLSHPGEDTCGDAFTVVESDEGLLIGVADGLGHGPKAAEAAQVAMAQLRSAPGLDLSEQLRGSDAALRRLRGAALTLVLVRSRTDRLTWTGVGNVEALLLGAAGERRYVPLRGGIVGHQMTRPRVADEVIPGGAWLLIWTDGVDPAVAQLTPGTESPEHWLRRVPVELLERGDDALLFAARLDRS